MGRYSRPLAGMLTDWLDVSEGQRALDVGCGPGALTGTSSSGSAQRRCRRSTRRRPSSRRAGPAFPGVDVRQGAAEALPYDDGVVRRRRRLPGRALHAGPGRRARRDGPRDPRRAAGWVRRSGTCTAGASRWPRSGRRLDEIDPDHPGERELPGGAEGQLVAHLRGGRPARRRRHRDGRHRHPPDASRSGGSPTSTASGPVGEAVAALDPVRREQLRATCRERLGDGPFDLTAVAFAARGRPERVRRHDDVGRRHGGGGRRTRGPGYAVLIMTRSLLLRCRSEV